jgi:transcriptional regulator with XRE-family HTH domain
MRFNNDTELYKTIGSNIKAYRKQANITQSKLAEEIGISLSYISKIEATECDKSFSLSTLNSIANALQVDIEKFFEVKCDD